MTITSTTSNVSGNSLSSTPTPPGRLSTTGAIHTNQQLENSFPAMGQYLSPGAGGLPESVTSLALQRSLSSCLQERVIRGQNNMAENYRLFNDEEIRDSAQVEQILTRFSRETQRFFDEERQRRRQATEQYDRAVAQYRQAVEAIRAAHARAMDEYDRAVEESAEANNGGRAASTERTPERQYPQYPVRPEDPEFPEFPSWQSLFERPEWKRHMQRWERFNDCRTSSYRRHLERYEQIRAAISQWKPVIGAHNYQFLLNWGIGTLPARIVYAPDSIQVQDMMKSLNVERARNKFYAAGAPPTREFSHDTLDAFLETIVNPLTADWKSTVMQVGGYAGATIKNNDDGTMTFRIRNVAGANSFFYHLVPNFPNETGLMHNVEQIFEWTERIDRNRLSN